MNSHAPESSNFFQSVPLGLGHREVPLLVGSETQSPRGPVRQALQGSGQPGPSGRGDGGPAVSGNSTQLRASILHKGRPSAGGSFPGPSSHPCGHITVTQQEAGLPRAQVSHRKVLLEALHGQEACAAFRASGPLPRAGARPPRCALRFLRPVLTLAVTPAPAP